MDLTPKTLREVVFREKLRGGYHPDDVDEFLEQVAADLEVLHDRLRQAVERAQRAEAAAAAAPSDANPGDAEESVKTLVLAQRTADMHVQEAREKANRLVANAEQQAQSIVSSAQERGKRQEEETLASTHAELIKLEATRAQAQQEVEGLNRWIEEHKAHLSSTLKDALGVVERAGTLSPPPTSRPIDVGRPEPAAGPAGAAPQHASVDDSGTPASEDSDTALLAPGHEAGDPDSTVVSGRPGPSGPEPPMGEASVKADPVGGARPAAAGLGGADPADQALDEFFDDPEFADDRRFGGRLRRRR